MAPIARRLMTGLALAGVAYALDPKRDLLRRGLQPGQLDRWREQLGPRLNQLQQQYGPTARRLAVAAGFLPGMRLRWRLLAALPQIAAAIRAAGPKQAETRRAAMEEQAL